MLTGKLEMKQISITCSFSSSVGAHHDTIGSKVGDGASRSPFRSGVGEESNTKTAAIGLKDEVIQYVFRKAEHGDVNGALSFTQVTSDQLNLGRIVLESITIIGRQVETINLFSIHLMEIQSEAWEILSKVKFNKINSLSGGAFSNQNFREFYS